MSYDRALYKQRYRQDPAWRASVQYWNCPSQDREGDRYVLTMKKRTWYSAEEMFWMLQITRRTFTRYQAMGVIPPATYPSGVRRYWPHQALWLIKLFRRMRAEGWPTKRPHFIGSRSWGDFLEEMHTDWYKEK